MKLAPKKNNQRSGLFSEPRAKLNTLAKGIAKNIKKSLLLATLSLGFITISTSNVLAAPPVLGAPCPLPGNGVLGIPTWYKYLDGKWVATAIKDSSGALVFDVTDPAKHELICQPDIKTSGGETIPFTAIMSISAAILDILVRLAGLVAFGYLVYGGFIYLTSSGESDKAKKAGSTLLNAAIGLAIAVSASAIINFFASRLTG